MNLNVIKRSFAERQPLNKYEIQKVLKIKNDNTLNQILSYLVSFGVLKRFEQGIYYIPSSTKKFENLMPSLNDVLHKKYLEGQQGIRTGAYLLYKYKLTTQVSLYYEILSNWIGYNKLDKNRIDMLSSYVLIYFILFIPTPIFDRPIYFLHGYIAIALSLIIYNIIYLLFEIILSKQAIETDKTLLSMQVSTLSKATETIATIAKSDTLTGLKNRYALYKEIDQLIKENTPFLLLFMDLNQLKMINDEYCHKQGDKYLAQFARTMSDLLMNDGTSYRFAGDEFIAILTNNMEMFNPDKFKLEVAQHINLDVPYLGFSIGLASFPSDGLTLDELIDIADKCMYQDKRG